MKKVEAKSGEIVMPDNNFLLRILDNAEILQGKISDNKGFCIDSRSIKKGEIFIALKGANCDGHDFLEDAINKGATGLILDKSNKKLIDKLNKKDIKDKFILLLEDPLNSLLKLANAWRKEFEFPVVAITGSVGKTSTKEILSNIISLSGKKYFVSSGNQNTLIGVILNILKLNQGYSGAIFELGINKRGEMEKLVELLKPTLAIITAIGHSHMAGLGSVNDIAIEKRQIFKLFKENNIGIVNGDQFLLASIGYKHPVLKFGCKTTNQVQARKVKVTEDGLNIVLKLYNKKYNIIVPIFSINYVYNYLAAASAALLLNISDEIIIKAIQRPIKIKGRFELKKMINNWGTIIDDCYNASPESVKSAILSFESIEVSGKKIFVFSDMFELGQDSSFWHRQIGRFLQKSPSVTNIILVGNQVKWTAKTLPVNLRAELVSNWQDAVKILEKTLVEDSLVLVKGSTQGYKTGLINLVSHFVDKDTDDGVSIYAAKVVNDDIILGRRAK